MSGRDSKKKSKPDWDRLREMKDGEIDTSDIPELSKEFFKKAKLRMPPEGSGSLLSCRLSLRHLLAQITGKNIHKGVDTGNPQGREDW